MIIAFSVPNCVPRHNMHATKSRNSSFSEINFLKALYYIPITNTNKLLAYSAQFSA